MWKSGALAFGWISKRGGNSGKVTSLFVFDFSTVSTARHFHSAFSTPYVGLQQELSTLP